MVNLRRVEMILFRVGGGGAKGANQQKCGDIQTTHLLFHKTHRFYATSKIARGAMPTISSAQGGTLLHLSPISTPLFVYIALGINHKINHLIRKPCDHMHLQLSAKVYIRIDIKL